MRDIEEIIGLLSPATAGVEGFDNGVYDDLRGVAAFNQSSAAKVAALEEQLAQVTAQVDMLKAANYDLIMSQQATQAPVADEADEADEADDEADEGGSIDDLFDSDDDEN